MFLLSLLVGIVIGAAGAVIYALVAPDEVLDGAPNMSAVPAVAVHWTDRRCVLRLSVFDPALFVDIYSLC
jgi:hypothetical protein